MNKMTFSMGLAAAAVLLSGAAQAEMAFGARIGPTVGFYEGELSPFRLTQDGVVVFDQGVQGDRESLYGIQTGIGTAFGDFFVDFGLDLLNIKTEPDEAKRTDIVLTGGYFIGSNWTVFGGIRDGRQGDGFFDKKNKEGNEFHEQGVFLGGGVGGQAGAVRLDGSLAVNFSKVKDFAGGDDLDYPGISVKFAGSLASMPQHGLQLRYQRFSGDDSIAFQSDDDNDGVPENNLFEFGITEEYYQLTYLYRFSM